MKKHVAIEYFDLVPFMKQKQRRKKRKERDKNKEPKESKKERQEGRKKDKNKRERERDRERNIEKGGGQKRLRRNKERHSIIDKKCPVLGEKTRFFVLRSKERKVLVFSHKKGNFQNPQKPLLL